MPDVKSGEIERDLVSRESGQMHIQSKSTKLLGYKMIFARSVFWLKL